MSRLAETSRGLGMFQNHGGKDGGMLSQKFGFDVSSRLHLPRYGSLATIAGHLGGKGLATFKQELNAAQIASIPFGVH